MFIFAFLPEIAAFLLFILVSIQDAGNGTLIVLTSTRSGSLKTPSLRISRLRG